MEATLTYTLAVRHNIIITAFLCLSHAFTICCWILTYLGAADWSGAVRQSMAEGKEEEETRTDVCPIAKTRREMTCMEALRVVLCEHDSSSNYCFSKRMKLMDEIEEEVRGVE